MAIIVVSDLERGWFYPRSLYVGVRFEDFVLVEDIAM